MKTLIAVRDVPVWCGESRHEVRAMLDAARLRERFPTTAALRPVLRVDDDRRLAVAHRLINHP